jgi:cation:H+ antiporter
MDFIYISIFVAGIWFLIKGADVIVAHASKLAHELGISKFMIGLTLVAFSTTLPELSVSVISALSGVASIATGTTVGSIIVNTGLILGLAAIIRPMTTDEESLKLSYFMMLFVLMTSLVLFDGVMWYEGAILLIAFLVYMYSYFLEVRKQRRLQTIVGPSRKRLIPKDNAAHNTSRHILMCIVGGVVIVMGAEMLITSTVNIAKWIGVSELLISLLVISLGTSLPELAVVMTGIMKRVKGISIGDIIGANIYNVFVLGVASLAAKIPVTQNLVLFNIPIMILLSFVLMISIKTKWKITRIEGLALLILYAAFVILQFA